MTAPVMKRAAAHGALILGVAVTSLAAAALFATLAAVGGGVLSRSVVHRVAALKPSDTEIAVTGPMSAANLPQVESALRDLLRVTVAARPFTLDRAETGRALDLPARAKGPRTTRIIAPVAATGARNQVTLVAGAWPAPPTASGPVDVALPVDVAATLGLRTGDTFVSADSFSNAPVPVRVSGLFKERDPAAPYWRAFPSGGAHAALNDGVTSYGPVLADPAAFSLGRLKLDSATWIFRPNLAGIDGGDFRPLADAVDRLQLSISQSSALSALQVTTNLPQSLRAAAGDAWAARSALAVATTLSALLALAALLLAIRLLRARREVEAAILRARGGAGWQLVAINAGEAVTCAIVVTFGGAYGGARLGDALAADAKHTGAPALGLWLAAGAVALTGALLMLGAGVGSSSPIEAWLRRSRQSTVPVLARAGGDLAVVALGAVAVWQLHDISLASTTNDGIDPVLVAAPALALAGATLALIRLVPPAARLGERWANHRRGLLGSLVTWDVSRRPSRFTGAVLLSVLAVTTGTFALTMHASWHRSQLDQAAFDTGADVRVDALLSAPADAAAIATAPGVLAATPMLTKPSDVGTVVAVNAATASAIEVRPDLSAVPASTLWHRIAPAGTRPGLVIPGRPQRIAVTASLRVNEASNTSADAVGVTLTLLDADGVAYQVAAGDLPGDGRLHVASGVIGASTRALYPLRLVNITLTGGFSAAAPSISSVSSADAAAGTLVPFASGAPFARWWQSAPESSGPAQLSPPCDVLGSECVWPSTPALGRLVLDDSLPPSALPAIATPAFLKAKGARLGDAVPVEVNGATITVRPVEQVAAFPTLGDSPVLALDLSTLQDAVLAEGSQPATVSEWLLRTRGGVVPAGLPSAASATSRTAAATALLNDPLGLASQRTWIVIAVAAAALALLGSAVNVAAELRSRRRDAALLAALGVSRWEQLRGLCLERLLLGTAASGLGLLIGAALSALLVTPVIPDASGNQPVPPVLVTYVWSWAVALAVVVAVGPVIAVAAGTLRRPDAAAELRLVEAM